MAAETPHPSTYNYTLEMLASDLEAANAVASGIGAAERAAGEAGKELEAIGRAMEAVGAASELVRKLYVMAGNMIEHTPDFIRHALALESSIASHRINADSNQREAVAAVGRARHAGAEAAAIELLIALRKAQEDRLAGVMGVGRPFGHGETSTSREREFILDAMEYARGAIKTSVKRAAVANAIRARMEQAKADALRWAKENEVVTFGARLIRYHGHDGRDWQGTCLLRTLEHRVGMTKGYTVDPFAAMLQVPLSPDDVAPLVPAMRSEPPLATVYILVSEAGKFEHSLSPFTRGE
jgi:hypothetical protein